MNIIPALLTDNQKSLLSQIKKLSSYFKYFQIDIADGLFVPNKTLGIENILTAIKEEDSCLLKDFSFDFHLMVKDWPKEIKKLNKLKKIINIKNVLIHYSVWLTVQSPLSNSFDFPLGIVLNPQDSVDQLIKKVDLQSISTIQIMSVNPGFQGSTFIKETVKKIGQLRKLNYKKPILLDGGINKKTLPFILLQKYRPDVLCIGSFLTKAKDLDQRISWLKKQGENMF